MTIDANGIYIVCPPGRVDERGYTVHTITRERARHLASLLEIVADAVVTEDQGR